MIEKFGPGLLFAATAVGVSHLVQSTRAGAEFGLTMAVLIIFACLIKYPAFRFGAEYAAAAEESLIVGYERQGRWLLMFFFIAIAIEGLTVIPAVSLVAAGMAMTMIGGDVNEIVITMAVIVLCSGILIFGRYRLLERVTKLLVATFAILSVVATVAAVSTVEPGQVLAAPYDLNEQNLFFAVAVAGWMPVGMGGAVFLAAWVRAKAAVTARPVTLQEARFDFNLGYVTTIAIALCFLLMGSLILFRSGVELSANSVGFASQLIGLFTESVGAWISPIVGVAAIAVMFSTVLAVIDGFPRVYADVTTRLFADRASAWGGERLYLLFMIVQAAVALGLLYFFLQRFGAFIDFVTTVGFLVAPVIAFLNHRVMTSDSIAAEARPAGWLRFWSVTGIAILTIVSVAYLAFRFI